MRARALLEPLRRSQRRRSRPRDRTHRTNEAANPPGNPQPDPTPERRADNLNLHSLLLHCTGSGLLLDTWPPLRQLELLDICHRCNAKSLLITNAHVYRRSLYFFPQHAKRALLFLLHCSHVHGSTELHNDSMGTNDNHESVMTLLNIYSHAQMIYSMSVTAHMASFPRSLSFPTVLDSIQALTATPKQGMLEWQPHVLGR